jgi:hypothetical protein
VFASAVVVIISARMFLGLLMKTYFQIHFPWIGTFFAFINDIFFDVTKPFPTLFYFAILLFVLIAIFLSPQREKLLVLYCIGLVSAAVMVGSPYVPARTFVLAIYMLISITAYLSSATNITSIDLRKASLLLLILATLLQMDKFLYYGTDAMRTEAIRIQLSDSYRAGAASGLITEKEWLVLPAQKEGSVFESANPTANRMTGLKRHYHLPADANVIIDDGFAIKSFSATQVNDVLYRFEITPLYDISDYTYTFYVQHNGITIYKSTKKTENFDTYEFPGPGTYTVSCILSNESNEQKEVDAFEGVEIK